MLTNNYDIILNPSHIDVRDMYEDQGMTTKALNSYIDFCLIDEQAEYDSMTKTYNLSVDSLSKKDFTDFLNLLLQDDTSTRDHVCAEMQKLIDERLVEKEHRARSNEWL